MVKTTVILEDELYKELVDEALRRYGSTRKLSTLINLRLKGEIGTGLKTPRTRSTIRLGRRLSEAAIEKAIETGWKESLKWKP